MSSHPPVSRPHPLRIVHVVDSLEVGGLERVTADLAMAQHQAGHRVTVFSLFTTDGLKAELQQAGIEVIEGHKRASLDRGALSLLRRTLRQQRAHIVHAHNFVPNYHAALAGLGLSARQVCTLHDMGSRLVNPRLRRLFKLSLLRTHQVAMVGSQVHRQHTGSGLVPSARAHVVLNGIPVERFEGSAQARSKARAELGLGSDDLVIGCVGRLVPLKNHHRMIEVMPRLLARHPDLRLLIIGDGERATALRELVDGMQLGKRVILAGQRQNVGALLPALDIFALPSQTEGLSIALLEACATGLAVVATQVGGNVEIIHDNQTGLLIPADDNDALFCALDRLASDAGLRRELGHRASTWVRDNASVQALMKAYDHVYQAALPG